METHLRPTVSQKALIQVGDKILLVQEHEDPWEIPGGRINEGEMDLEEALKREIREELSLEVSVERLFAAHIYQNRRGENALALVYLCRLESSLDDLKMQEKEISNWKLFSKEELRTLVPLESNSEKAIKKFASN